MRQHFVCALMATICIAYFAGANSITCNVCVGSTSSDCARDDKSAMIEQECKDIHLPQFRRHHHHGRDGHHNQDDDAAYDVTTAVNDIVTNTLDTTPRPETEDFQRMEEASTTTTTPLPDRVFEASCMYLRVKATNTTSALVMRGCGYAPPKKDFCTMWHKLNKNIVECKTCDTDECN